jgi:hypothetical protein
MEASAAVPPKKLIVAAVVAGAAGLALFAAGWWIQDWQQADGSDRLADGSWWAGAIVRGLGYLAFGQVGFKVALAVLLAAGVVIARVQRRRTPNLPADTSEQAVENSTDGEHASR